MIPLRLQPFLGFLKQINFRPRVDVSLSYSGQSVEIRFMNKPKDLKEYYLVSVPIALFNPEKKGSGDVSGEQV